MQDKNTLYYGDNLEILRRYVKDETVDLIYLDPPFKSNQNYNVLFQEQNGSRSQAQLKAFEDTWRWDQAAARAFEETVESGGRVAEAMQAFRKLLGHNDMLAYLSMMAPRLLELRRVLKDTGSIYLHCDPTASAHLRLLMDAVFAPANFRNEIVWRYKKYQKAMMGYFARNSHRLLFYVRDASRPYTFRPVQVKLKKPKRFLKRTWDKHSGRIVNVKGPDGKVVYMEVWEEKTDEVWELPYLMPAAREKLGYPTQKPESLLQRVICSSSNEGDLVLDPFCGCGTTVCVAERLNRRWIGIDISHLAVTLIKHRLGDAFGDEVAYEVVGEPVSISGAMALAKEDPYQFQWWALGLVGARPVEQKKGADKGIDGRLYFHDERRGAKTKQIVFSVKAGYASVVHVRDLRGVVDREGAEIGVLITMLRPSQQMRAEAAGAGFYDSPASRKRYPRLQILTVEELMGGKQIDYPLSRHVNVTFKKAPRANKGNDNPSVKLFD